MQYGDIEMNDVEMTDVMNDEELVGEDVDEIIGLISKYLTKLDLGWTANDFRLVW